MLFQPLYLIQISLPTAGPIATVLSRVRSGRVLFLATADQQGGSTQICPIAPLPKITKCDILSEC